MASLLSALVFTTQVALSHAAEVNLWAERRRAAESSRVDAGGTAPARLPVPAPCSSPLEKIVDIATQQHDRVKVDPAGSRILVFIQDVHANSEAQRGTRELIAALAKNGLAGAVALEGAFDAMDLSAFRAFADRDALFEAVDYLLRIGGISGAAAAVLASSAPTPVIGVDDRALYAANVAAYLATRASVEPVDRRLKSARVALDEDRRVSPALAAFDRAARAYREETRPLGSYLSALTAATETSRPNVASFLRALDFEKRLDLPRTEAERSEILRLLAARLNASQASELLKLSVAFRAGGIAPAPFYERFEQLMTAARVPLASFPAFRLYVDYVLESQKVDGAALFAESDELETLAYARLSRTEADRRWAAESRFVSLAHKLLRFTLSPAEWTAYKKLKDASPLRPALVPFEGFYTAAEARDEAMARNLLSALEKRGVSSAIMVAGGFHADGVARRAKAAGWTIASITPPVSGGDLSTASGYLTLFAREKTPLEKIFTPQRLFVAPDPFAEAGKLPAITAGVRIYRGRSSDPAPDLKALAPRATLDAASGRKFDDGAEVDVDAGGRRTAGRLFFDAAGRLVGFVDRVVRAPAAPTGPLGVSARSWAIIGLVLTLTILKGPVGFALGATLAMAIAPPTDAPRTILYIEDREDQRITTVMLLKLCGYHVLAAANGVDAIALGHQFHADIDLVLSDVDLPDFNGDEIYRRFQADDNLRHIPYVFYSGRDRQSLTELGIPDTVPAIQKGADFTKIIDTLNAALAG
ncbi:MAG: response regulator, partial [Elusimicrobia bacterium]|nr:response regulator [Elusimicrobiota bacterium]